MNWLLDFVACEENVDRFIVRLGASVSLIAFVSAVVLMVAAVSK